VHLVSPRGDAGNAGAGPATMLPSLAAWQHLDAREGFEVVFIHRSGAGHRFSGSTVAVQAGVAWCIDYELTLDGSGATRSAEIRSRFQYGEAILRLESTEVGEWWANGRHMPALRGCLDVDLEASALTNAFPVRRLALRAGAAASAPAVFVRVGDLRVERLEQRYECLAGTGAQGYRYSAPRFDFTATLRYDRSGLVVDYPGIAERKL
jgi:uncharacterized protein